MLLTWTNAKKFFMFSDTVNCQPKKFIISSTNSSFIASLNSTVLRPSSPILMNSIGDQLHQLDFKLAVMTSKIPDFLVSNKITLMIGCFTQRPLAYSLQPSVIVDEGISISSTSGSLSLSVTSLQPEKSYLNLNKFIRVNSQNGVCGQIIKYELTTNEAALLLVNASKEENDLSGLQPILEVHKKAFVETKMHIRIWDASGNKVEVPLSVLICAGVEM